jgi:cysteine desulfurase / selenocysteine lyase
MGLYAGTALQHEFPTLDREGLVYLDSAATSQTPRAVIDAMTSYYETTRSSVHRGVYPLAVEATELFEAGREKAASWLRWDPECTIFTRNATEALNLVAATWGRANIGPGDRIVLTELEHHSNLVPWQQLAIEKGAALEWVPIDDEGVLDLDVLDGFLQGGRVKVVAVGHISNVTGTINPVAEIVERAHAHGAIVSIDGTQAVPQIPVDLSDIGADFYSWTGHKAYGPTGIGILHGRRDLLEAMPPWLTGGHMVKRVTKERTTWGELPHKFEAGTSAIAEGVGLGAAVDFIRTIGMEDIRAHEHDLVAYALERMAEIPGITLHGPRDADRRGAVVSFALEHAHPHDIGEILGREGVCVRAGHHCAQVLMTRLGVGATARASFAIHNTREDVDALVAGLGKVAEVFA